MTVELKLQPGPQTVAACSDATVIFYGGAKGSGKTRWAEHTAMDYYDVPGHSTIIFRRTYPELKGPGSIWEDTFNLYPHLAAVPVESKLTWTFPSGKTIALRHLQHEKDADAWNGKNIPEAFFEELTFFTEKQFWTIFSCLRSRFPGVPTRLRATCNPDPDSWVLQFVEWYLDANGYPIPERSGVVRWFARIAGKLQWFESRDAALAAGAESATSFTFVSANIWDNPALLSADPQYLANLRALPPVEQARYLGGNWKVRAAAGDYFQESWFPMLEPGPIGRKMAGQQSDDYIVRKIRVWDFAATPYDGDQVVGAPVETRSQRAGDPDWTRGLLIAEFRNKTIAVLDMVSARDTAGAIEWLVKETARRDGPRTRVVIPQDPAQAGLHQVATYTKALRGVARVDALRPGNPLDWARIASRVAFARRVLVLPGAWNANFFRELEAFPKKGVHDDIVSALAMGCVYLLENPRAINEGSSKARPTDFEPGANSVGSHKDFGAL